MGAPEEEIIERALDSPIGTERLEKMASGKKDVVIITSDITRPMPSWRVLPHVLKRLEKAGVSRSHITVVFAMGTHRRHTSEEMRHLAGDEVYNTCRCMDSSECSFIHMGETKAGTPVDIADKVAHADLRICLGNIEYHFCRLFGRSKGNHAGRFHHAGHSEKPQQDDSPHGKGGNP